MKFRKFVLCILGDSVLGHTQRIPLPTVSIGPFVADRHSHGLAERFGQDQVPGLRPEGAPSERVHAPACARSSFNAS